VTKTNKAKFFNFLNDFFTLMQDLVFLLFAGFILILILINNGIKLLFVKRCYRCGSSNLLLHGYEDRYDCKDCKYSTDEQMKKRGKK
jgi:ribosomal protein S27AE